MSPVEDNPDMWSAVMRYLRPLYESLAWALPFLLPALFGTLARSSGAEQRKMSRWQWVNAIFWATVTGAGLAPLAAYYTGAPDKLVYSIAFLLGILAYDKTNNVAGIIRRAREVLQGEVLQGTDGKGKPE